MLAFDNVMVNLDSYIGKFKQNYYLYQDDNGRFNPIIWDLNMSFGVFSDNGTTNLTTTTAKAQMTHLLHANDAAWPLVQKLLAVPSYKRKYLAHFKTILEENMDFLRREYAGDTWDKFIFGLLESWDAFGYGVAMISFIDRVLDMIGEVERGLPQPILKPKDKRKLIDCIEILQSLVSLRLSNRRNLSEVREQLLELIA
jgi:hypothetical protein